MSVEEWKDVVDYEGLYAISNLGRVKNINRNRIIDGCDDGRGYKITCLTKGVKVTSIRIHILVAKAFLGHIGNDRCVVVDHINEIKHDNRLSNLQVISSRENTSRSKKRGTSKYAGVSWCKRGNKWKAGLRINGKQVHLGYFHDELVASEAYKNKLKEIK